MRRSRLLLLALASWLVLGSPAADAGPRSSGLEPAAASVRLTETVTLSASGTAFTTVHLGETLDFRGAAPPVLQASDPDTLDGVVLVEVAPGSAAPGVAMLALRDGPLSSSYVFFGTDDGDQVTGRPIFLDPVLPPGTYRLLLLSRGANTVTVTFPGASPGSSAVHLDQATRHTATDVAASGVPGAPVVPAVTAAVTFTSETRPLQLGIAWLRSTSAASRFYACATQDPDAVDVATTSTPYCPAMAGINSVGVGVDRVEVFQASFQPAAASWQFKTVVASAGLVSAGGALSLQVDLGPGYPTS